MERPDTPTGKASRSRRVAVAAVTYHRVVTSSPPRHSARSTVELPRDRPSNRPRSTVEPPRDRPSTARFVPCLAHGPRDNSMQAIVFGAIRDKSTPLLHPAPCFGAIRDKSPPMQIVSAWNCRSARPHARPHARSPRTAPRTAPRTHAPSDDRRGSPRAGQFESTNDPRIAAASDFGRS